MQRWSDKVAVVTGASSGIGEAIAKELVEHGLKVVGLARRKDRLEALAKTLSGKKGQFFFFVTDLSKADDIVKAFAWIKKCVGPVHILINNAGVFKPATFFDVREEDINITFDVNVKGLTIAAREALAVFKENNINGHIINVNSIAGHRVVDYPSVGIYTASKYAVTALSESLRLEMKRNKMGTKITSISPGLVETEIIPNLEELKKSPEYVALQVKDIADATVYILSTPPNVQIDELTIQPIYVPK